MKNNKEKNNKEKNIKKKRIVKTAVVIFIAVFLIAYVVLVNVLLNAALVPSFMRKLDSFEKISDECFSEQVYTDDITENYKKSVKETNEWLKELKEKKLSEKIYIESKEGYKLIAARFNQGEESGHKWALVLHGYTGWKEEMYPYALWYYKMGYSVIVPDLRCQGESEGDYIGMGWTDHYDCMGWLSYIISQDENAEIVIHGQSMGASTSLIMTGDNDLPENVKAVVSDCAYTDAYSMFGNKVKEWFHLPCFPLVDSACLMLIIRGGYDLKKASAIDAVKKSSTPTLFIHGKEDALISVDMAYELYEGAVCPKQLLIVEGAGHAQSQDKDPEKYYDTIREFLSNYVSF